MGQLSEVLGILEELGSHQASEVSWMLGEWLAGICIQLSRDRAPWVLSHRPGLGG